MSRSVLCDKCVRRFADNWRVGKEASQMSRAGTKLKRSGMPVIAVLGAVVIALVAYVMVSAPHQVDPDPVTAAAAPSAHHRYLINCVGDAVEHPLTFDLSCASGPMTLMNIQWQHWGNSEATASATYADQDCRPNCAEGATVLYSTKVRVYDVVNKNGTSAYRRVALKFDGAKPNWVSKDKVARWTLF